MLEKTAPAPSSASSSFSARSPEPAQRSPVRDSWASAVDAPKAAYQQAPVPQLQPAPQPLQQQEEAVEEVAAGMAGDSLKSWSPRKAKSSLTPSKPPVAAGTADVPAPTPMGVSTGLTPTPKAKTPLWQPVDDSPNPSPNMGAANGGNPLRRSMSLGSGSERGSSLNGSSSLNGKIVILTLTLIPPLTLSVTPSRRSDRILTLAPYFPLLLPNPHT